MAKGNQILKSACAELQPGVPLIEICGNRRVLIENHQGIGGYDCNEILVKSKIGCICIRGEQMKIVKMSKEKLIVFGKIHLVQLQGRG